MDNRIDSAPPPGDRRAQQNLPTRRRRGRGEDGEPGRNDARGERRPDDEHRRQLREARARAAAGDREQRPERTKKAKAPADDDPRGRTIDFRA